MKYTRLIKNMVASLKSMPKPCLTIKRAALIQRLGELPHEPKKNNEEGD